MDKKKVAKKSKEQKAAEKVAKEKIKIIEEIAQLSRHIKDIDKNLFRCEDVIASTENESHKRRAKHMYKTSKSIQQGFETRRKELKKKLLVACRVTYAEDDSDNDDNDNGDTE